MNAIVPVTAAAPVAIADTDSWTAVAGQVASLAERIATTEFVPKGFRGNPPR